MRILKKLYIDGFILALVGAVALGAVVPTSGRAAEILSWATKLAIGLLFFMYGARLSATEVWAGLRNWRLQITALTLTFVMYPLLGLAIGAAFGRFLPDEFATGIVFLTLVSATVQTCISYTAIARGNVPAAVVAASTSATLGVFLTPLFVTVVLASSSDVHVDLGAVVSIVTQLLLPFVAGQLFHPRLGGFMRRHDTILKRTDRSFIVLVVFSAFSAGTAAGVWGSLPLSRFALIVALCVGLLLTALAVTTLSGKLLRFSREDRIVVMFVGTSKSVTAGLPIAAVLFAGDGMALIIVPLMIYHQAQLIICAILSQRLGRDAPAEEPARSGMSPAGEELLHRLGVQPPSGGDGGITWISGDAEEPAGAALESADVVGSEARHDDPRARWHVGTRIGMFAAGIVGAWVVDVDARPAVERFATSARTIEDKQRLIEELRSAGMLDGDADAGETFVALLTAAGDHPIRVVGFDTRVGQTAGVRDTAEGARRRLQTANPYMAAVLSRTLAELPPGKKVVALVGAVHTNSVGGDDDYLDSASIAQRNGNLHAEIDLHPGDAIYYQQHMSTGDAVADDDMTLVYEPAPQRHLA